MEKRTEKDLSYEFTMPFPGRRQLADVVTAVQEVCATMDPNGVNISLRKIMLRFFFEQIGIDDVSRAVEECIPKEGMPGGIGPQQTTGNGPGAFAGKGTGAGAPGATGSGAGAGANDPAGDAPPYGAKAGTAGTNGDGGALESEWLEPLTRKSVDELNGATVSLFRRVVADPAVQAALGMAPN